MIDLQSSASPAQTEQGRAWHSVPAVVPGNAAFPYVLGPPIPPALFTSVLSVLSVPLPPPNDTLRKATPTYARLRQRFYPPGGSMCLFFFSVKGCCFSKEVYSVHLVNHYNGNKLRSWDVLKNPDGFSKVLDWQPQKQIY